MEETKPKQPEADKPPVDPSSVYPEPKPPTNPPQPVATPPQTQPQQPPARPTGGFDLGYILDFGIILLIAGFVYWVFVIVTGVSSRTGSGGDVGFLWSLLISFSISWLIGGIFLRKKHNSLKFKQLWKQRIWIIFIPLFIAISLGILQGLSSDRVQSSGVPRGAWDEVIQVVFYTVVFMLIFSTLSLAVYARVGNPHSLVHAWANILRAAVRSILGGTVAATSFFTYTIIYWIFDPPDE